VIVVLTEDGRISQFDADTGVPARPERRHGQKDGRSLAVERDGVSGRYLCAVGSYWGRVSLMGPGAGQIPMGSSTQPEVSVRPEPSRIP
jgi:hypothetical protein